MAGQVSAYFITPLEGLGQVQFGLAQNHWHQHGITFTAVPPDAHDRQDAARLPGRRLVGILAPAGTPPAIVAKLNDAITRAVATPFRARDLKKLVSSRKLNTRGVRCNDPSRHRKWANGG